MRRIVMSGIVGLAAVLGGTIPAAAASAAPSATTASTARTATARPDGVIAGSADVLGSSISCGSATTCLAVGGNINSNGNSTPTAEALKGTTWKSVPVKIPSGATSTGLGSVSCKAATYCLAVGDYTTASGEHPYPYALTWNGTALTPITAPPVPKGGSLVSLGAVSCVAVKSCVAAGSSVTVSGTKDTFELFADTWNGATWTEAASTSPSGAELPGVMALRCFSAKNCVAAGDAYATTSAAESVFAATWNGKAWTTEKAVTPAGQIVFLNDLSCVSATSCAMVGLSENSAGTSGFGFLEVWNGKTWSETKYQAPKGDTQTVLLGVSCASSSNCIATGGAGTSKTGDPAALSWNGKKWTALKVPGPAKGDSSYLEGVSCPKANDCVAIGQTGKTSGTTTSPLAGYWNGKVWKLAAA